MQDAEGFDDDGQHHTLKSIHCKVRQLWVYILRIPIQNWAKKEEGKASYSEPEFFIIKMNVITPIIWAYYSKNNEDNSYIHIVLPECKVFFVITSQL